MSTNTQKPLASDDAFYDRIAPVSDFAGLSGTEQYRDVPEDWFVGVADIVDSTREIASGRYKAVNMVAASVISVMVNELKPHAFPYVFGGDGAGFAIWPKARDLAERALVSVQAWAQREFGMQLRVALVPVRAIRRVGLRVQVARYRASEGVDYAMFSGGGLNWAEAQMKAGLFSLPVRAGVASPNLTGLSCRWANAPARNGKILSVVILPVPGAAEGAFGDVARAVLKIGEGLEMGGHPIPTDGPGVRYPPPGIGIDAHVSRGRRPFWMRMAELLLSNLFFGGLFILNARLGQFDAGRYRAEVAANADFRKFDDGLKMTLDCDAATRARLEAVLSRAQGEGVIRYGMYEQDEAMMTCLVPSPMENTHVHFVDGAGGGYTQAAAQIKATV